MGRVQVTPTEFGKMVHPLLWWIDHHRELGIPTSRLLKAYKGDGIIDEINGVKLIIDDN